jgi:hypothetical protein
MRGQLLACGAVSVVATGLLASLAALGLQDASPATRTLALFEVAAAAMFLAGSLLRFARWRVTGLPHSGYLSLSLAVLALVALPAGELPSVVQPPLHAAGSLLALGLALRALHLATDPVPGTPVTGLVGVALGLGAVALLTTLAVRLPAGTPSLPGLLVSVGLALAWCGGGLHSARRDATQSWAGRVAPLFGCLGVVELLRSLDHVRPDSWLLPAAALLASVAMVAAHSSYVDLVESLAAAHRVDRVLAHDVVPSQERGEPVTEAVEFEVATIVSAIARRFSTSGQQVRVRGGMSHARGRPGDLWRALEGLLENALRHAPGSPVTVHVLAIGSQVEVSVTDRGPGLTSSLAERVLDARSPALPSGPDGVGLPEARALMRSNGGDLELRNRIGGATFVLTLPAARQPSGSPAFATS